MGPLILSDAPEELLTTSYDLTRTKPLAQCMLTCRDTQLRMKPRDDSANAKRDREGYMNGLPDKANSVARVRSIERGGEGAESARRLEASAAPPPQQGPTLPRPLRLLRLPAVLERTGLSRSTIWRLERRGEFPRHHRIAPNIVAWLEEEVTDWIRSRTDAVAS